MANFPLIFGLALVLNVAITARSSDLWKKHVSGRGAEAAATESKEELEQKKKWESVLKKYMAVYLLATLSDWLQGPMVYALYDDYGYSQHEIAVLFVAGFGSSMIFGSFIGGMADWGGRRSFVVLYAIIYAASCVTKHFKSFNILMLGRLLGGVCTSLLFSVFEAWLIRAHADHGIKNYLNKSFSWAAYGNSVIAIIAGLVANKAASLTAMFPVTPGGIFYAGGFLTPFDIAMGVLVLCGTMALMLWEENYGDSSSSNEREAKWYDGLKNALVTTVRSQDILLCGIISSLYEGSMYIFVFMWTPALKAGTTQDLPFGIIFSTFMVCCMAGSSLFSIQIEIRKAEQLAVYVFAVAAIAMGLISIANTNTTKFVAMNLFEMTVGMYFPIMGTMKGVIVPESKRAAIYNLYRIPLNFIVLFSLLTDLTPSQSFGLNCVMLSTAAVLMYILMKRREKMGMPAGDDIPRKQAEGVPLMEKADSNV